MIPVTTTCAQLYIAVTFAPTLDLIEERGSMEEMPSIAKDILKARVVL